VSYADGHDFYFLPLAISLKLPSPVFLHPSFLHQRRINITLPKTPGKGILEFGIWILFGSWNLEFEIWLPHGSRLTDHDY